MYAKRFITVTNVYKNYIEKYLLLILKFDKKCPFYFKLTHSFYTLAKIFGVQNQKKDVERGGMLLRKLFLFVKTILECRSFYIKVIAEDILQKSNQVSL